MRSTPSSVGIIVVVSLVIWVFFMEPGLFLFGGLLFLIGIVCFRAGVTAKDTVEENKPEPEGDGFRTYKQRQQENVEMYTKKTSKKEEDTKLREQRKALLKEVMERRKAEEKVLENDIQDTP